MEEISFVHEIEDLCMGYLFLHHDVLCVHLIVSIVAIFLLIAPLLLDFGLKF